MNAAKTHQTALHMACTNNCLPMVQLLLEFGANVFTQTYWGKTASQIVTLRSPLHRLLKHYEGQYEQNLNSHDR